MNVNIQIEIPTADEIKPQPEVNFTVQEIYMVKCMNTKITEQLATNQYTQYMELTLPWMVFGTKDFVSYFVDKNYYIKWMDMKKI